MKRLAASLGLLLALAGCDGGSEPREVTKITIADTGAYVARLRALSPINRDLALRRAIQDSGKSCRRITASGERGIYKTTTMWAARCEGGRDWGVFIAPGGDVQVRDCAHMEQLALPACRIDG